MSSQVLFLLVVAAAISSTVTGEGSYGSYGSYDSYDSYGSYDSPSPSPSPSTSPVSPSPSPSPIPIEVGADVVVGGTLNMDYDCSGMVETVAIKKSVVDIVRSENNYTAEQMPYSTCTITRATCGNEIIGGRRKLAAVNVEFEISITAEAAQAAGIATDEDVAAILSAIQVVTDGGAGESEFLTSLSAHLYEEEGIIIAVEDMTITSVDTFDSTDYAAASSSDDSTGIEGWAIALIVVASFMAIALIVAAICVVSTGKGAADSGEYGQGMFSNDKEEQLTFATTTAPHAL